VLLAERRQLNRKVAIRSLTIDCVHTEYVRFGVAELRFEWNPDKSAANARKHGVTFDEAESVFADEQALLIDDPEHSAAEERFVLLGLSAMLRVLVVVHCYRGMTRSFASSQRGRLLNRSGSGTTRGGDDEKGV
jgi:uncharacterized DUF497 family protein